MNINAIINNPIVWIIAFFISVIIIIMMIVVLILIKMKTNAFVELKSFFKKVPVSLFFEDGKFLEMKACEVDAGLIRDKEYGTFIRNEKNSYLGRSTRNVYDVYDTSFAPGINIKAAHTAEVLKELLENEDDFYQLQKLIASGELPDDNVDCIRSNVNTSSLKQLYNCIEPHNINASVEKKVAKQVSAMNSKGNAQIILIFIAVFGAMIGGYILLKMFNV